MPSCPRPHWAGLKAESDVTIREVSTSRSHCILFPGLMKVWRPSMRPLKMMILEYLWDYEAPLPWGELGTKEFPGEVNWSVSEPPPPGTSDLGMRGEAQIITPFERFTPNPSSNYKKELRSPANRETWERKVISQHPWDRILPGGLENRGCAGQSVSRDHWLLPSYLAP